MELTDMDVRLMRGLTMAKERELQRLAASSKADEVARVNAKDSLMLLAPLRAKLDREILRRGLV